MTSEPVQDYQPADEDARIHEMCMAFSVLAIHVFTEGTDFQKACMSAMAMSIQQTAISIGGITEQKWQETIKAGQEMLAQWQAARSN